MPESVYHDHGRCILSRVYWSPSTTSRIPWVMRATFTDDDGDGLSPTPSAEVSMITIHTGWSGTINGTVGHHQSIESVPLQCEGIHPEMGLNQLLYGARNFDPVLGRWWPPGSYGSKNTRLESLSLYS